VIDRGFLRLPDENDIYTDNIWFMEQVHSNVVVEINDISTEMKNFRIVTGCDGLIAKAKPGYFLAVRTADCFPVLIYDDTTKMIAVAHCGREGTRLKLLTKILDLLIKKYRSLPKNIHISIGPGICETHYEVSEEIVTDFRKSVKDENLYRNLDLQKILIKTANKSCILLENIHSNAICTYENECYFSFRRDQTKLRNISIIGIQKQ
jgi:hypothetical protein